MKKKIRDRIERKRRIKERYARRRLVFLEKENARFATILTGLYPIVRGGNDENT